MSEPKGGMLVLSRHVDEPVFITSPSGETMEVCLVFIQKDKVKIGFRAPKEWSIMRHDAKKSTVQASIGE